MASGRLFLAAALALSAYTVLPTLTRAEDSAQSDPDGKHVFQGEVNANAVFVRSRASEDAYPTMKLSKGTKLTVSGIKGQWLKIEPPDGSFAYIPKAYVTLRNDGTVGRATRDTIAHAGSQLNDLAAVPMATVHEGEDVQILGQYNEYFKIKPPKDSFVWINKQFVDPVQTVAKADPAPTPAPTPDKPETPEPKTGQDSVATGHGSTTQPSSAAENTSTPASTQPAYNAIAEYDKLEQQFQTLNAQPIDKQPLPQLLADYQKVNAADDLPTSMRSIAEIRIATLKVRNDAREKYLVVQENEKKMVQQRQALVAERQEIEDRIKKNDIQIYAAVGTLRPSSLQTGTGVLYRLTDPASGRTVCYLRTTDSKYSTYLGQFIGVRGTINNDPQLKSLIENPVEAQSVDPTKVNQSIAAQIVPPSLVKFAAPAIPTASIAPAPSPVAPSTQPATPASTDTASTGNEPQ
ncbi:MAG TPA: SH3 domain-containing protein [Tepidisphaeraceae bacterium]|jgi:uncharacterized protein YgiM (DUF1202 family)|nr:SH3 domain-containing protein [Tepidisphaeraceae bacterium]